MKNNKSKLFPYGYMSSQIKGYCPRTKKPIFEYIHTLPKRKTYYRTCCKISIILLLLCISILVFGCSSQPIVDSRGKSSANIQVNMDRYHDDYYTCESLVKDNTNIVLDKTKTVYNGLRWRLLWLSPKLRTRQDLINNCLEGRGYNVLNK